jgi:hypothetical protein
VFREEEQSGGWDTIAKYSAGEPVFVATGRVNVTAKARAWVKLSSRMIVYNPQAGFGDEFSWPSKTGTFVS